VLNINKSIRRDQQPPLSPFVKWEYVMLLPLC